MPAALSRRLGALFLVLLLPGCGARFFYTQLDWIAPWYVSEFVTLDREQRVLLDQRLAEWLDWHCRSQLPDYAAWLREVGRLVEQGEADVAAVERLFERVEGFRDALLAGVAPDLAELLAMLSEEQIDELARQIEARNREARVDFVDAPPQILHERRVRRFERRLTRWLGPLTDAQRERIEHWSLEIVPIADDWLASRVDWQRRLDHALREQALREHAGHEAFRERIYDLVLRPEQTWSEDYRARLARNRALVIVLIADIAALAPQFQRERLQRETDSLAAQFESLACLQSGETALHTTGSR
jgi:hypothetical protein